MALAIDTQKSFDLFVDAGFNKKQAQALVEFERQKEDSHLATKADIARLKIWFLSAMLTQTIALIAVILSV